MYLLGCYEGPELGYRLRRQSDSEEPPQSLLRAMAKSRGGVVGLLQLLGLWLAITVFVARQRAYKLADSSAQFTD